VKSLAVRFGFVTWTGRCFRDDICSSVMLRGINRNDKVVRVVVSIWVCDAICRLSASRRALTSLMVCSALKTLSTMRWVC
jgi:hypothetical protein